MRIGLVDDPHAGNRNSQRLAVLHNAPPIADQDGLDEVLPMSFMDATEALFRIGGGQHQPLVLGAPHRQGNDTLEAV
jgi:hypothetical protein